MGRGGHLDSPGEDLPDTKSEGTEKVDAPEDDVEKVNGPSVAFGAAPRGVGGYAGLSPPKRQYAAGFSASTTAG